VNGKRSWGTTEGGKKETEHYDTLDLRQEKNKALMARVKGWGLQQAYFFHNGEKEIQEEVCKRNILKKRELHPC